MPGRKWQREQMETAILAYQRGEVSIRVGAEQYGINRSTFVAHLKKRGVIMHASGCSGLRGAAHPAWKGGIGYDKDGYIKTYDPAHPWPRKSGYVREHVRVMELHLGRPLTEREAVHHIDSNIRNNALSNLVVLDRSEHARSHRILEAPSRRRDQLGRFA